MNQKYNVIVSGLHCKGTWTRFPTNLNYALVLARTLRDTIPGYLFYVQGVNDGR